MLHLLRLRTRLRAQDPVGRYGGEEFMVLLPHTPLGGALELAETLRRARAAGFDVVWPRSKFSEELETALPRWLGAV